MRSLVTSELFRSLPRSDMATLRFNFRGVEGSEGAHGGGIDERHDVIAAIDRLRVADVRRAPRAGGLVVRRRRVASVLDDRLAGWFLIAPPLRVLPARRVRRRDAIRGRSSSPSPSTTCSARPTARGRRRARG